MAKRPVPVEEVWQNIIEPWLNENMRFDPKQQQRFFTSNIVQRTMAHIFGVSGSVSVPIKATSSGGLVTATSGPSMENYTKFGLTFADNLADVLAAVEIGVRADIWIWTNPVLIRMTSDGTIWGDWFELSAGSFHSIDFSLHSIEIKNKTAGANARYQVNVYY